MSLRETLSQLPPDLEVVLRPNGGTVTYTDRASQWLADDGVLHRLDDFELVTEVHLPNGTYGGTLADLMAEEIEPIRFVINGLLPEGLTMLAGKPKLGKSWLALGVSLNICAGEPALGHPTTKAEVLYIALEDGKRRMQSRVRVLGGDKMNPEDLGRFHYRTEWPALTAGGIDALANWMGEHPETRLVVVDTYGKVQGELAGKNRYTEEYAVLGELQSFATQHRIAVILVHHLRKQGADDWLEQLSGSQAVTGAADTLLGLFRERGQMDATLRLVSREVDEKDLALRFDAGRWSSMGDAVAYRLSVERTEVLEAIEALGEASPSDIAALVHKSPPNVSKMLASLDAMGLVESLGRGRWSLKVRVNTVTQDTLTPSGNTVTGLSTNNPNNQNIHGTREAAQDLEDSPDPW